MVAATANSDAAGIPAGTSRIAYLVNVGSAGTVTLCTQCAARRSIGPDDVLPGIRIAGAATFVEEALADGAQALVY